MTITIEVDEATKRNLEDEAKAAGKSLEEHVSNLVARSSQMSLTRPAGRGIWMSDDFDEPLEDFKDYR